LDHRSLHVADALSDTISSAIPLFICHLHLIPTVAQLSWIFGHNAPPDLTWSSWPSAQVREVLCFW